MFGSFKRRKLRKTEALLARELFISRVEEWRERSGFPKATLPPENLVLFFAANIADLVFQNAKNSLTPETSADAVETAAMLVVLAQSVHTGAREVGITDVETKSIIIQNGMALFLKKDSGNLSPQARTAMSLGTKAYASISATDPDILRQIAELSRALLLRESKESLTGLVDCWIRIVKFIDPNRTPQMTSA